MKKKAITETKSKGNFARFCIAQESKAKISLILAAVVVLGTIGSVSAAAIWNNPVATVPSENMELNAAEQFLATATQGTSESEETEEYTVGSSESEETTLSEEPRETKRGGLTGEHVVNYSDLKSLSNDELVTAIVSGKAGVISSSKIKKDQSQNTNNTHKGTTAKAPTPPPATAEVKTVNFELGIDISEFQGSINWSKVRKDGITFAFIRIGGRGWGSAGKIYDDTRFYENVKNAKAAGVKVGVYFFSQAITPYEALEEASTTLNRLNGMGLDLPVVLDWETGDGYRTAKLKGKDFADVITSFCSTIAQHGYTPCVYLNTSDINSRLGSYKGDILGKYKLWYAYPYSIYWKSSKDYKHNYFQKGDTIPPRDYAFEYWQYSWHGKVSGISTDVDLNLRILGSTTLYPPKINIQSEKVTSEVNQPFDPLNGVTATNSQKENTTTGLSYTIKDANGKDIALETAQKTIGQYTIKYSFMDSFRGTISTTITWEVTVATTPTPGESSGTGDVTPTPAETPSTGDPTPTPAAENTPAETPPTPTPEETKQPDPTPAEAVTPPAEEGT